MRAIYAGSMGMGLCPQVPIAGSWTITGIGESVWSLFFQGGVQACKCRSNIRTCWISILFWRLHSLMPPTDLGAKTMLHGRDLWYPILLRIVEVERQCNLSKKLSGNHVAGNGYISTGKKHEWYKMPAFCLSMGVQWNA